VTKSQYLKPGKLGYLEDNLGSTHRPELVRAAQEATDGKGVRRARKAFQKWTAAHGKADRRQRQRASPFLEFSTCDSTSFIRLLFAIRQFCNFAILPVHRIQAARLKVSRNQSDNWCLMFGRSDYPGYEKRRLGAEEDGVMTVSRPRAYYIMLEAYR
jgi:hypothetical protein